MQGDHGSHPCPPGRVGQEREPTIGFGNHGVHEALRLPHGKGGVGEVLLDGVHARTVLSDEEVAGAAGLVGGNVAGDYIKHALDLGEGGVRIRLEGDEGGAEALGVGTIQRRRRRQARRWI